MYREKGGRGESGRVGRRGGGDLMESVSVLTIIESPDDRPRLRGYFQALLFFEMGTRGATRPEAADD